MLSPSVVAFTANTSVMSQQAYQQWCFVLPLPREPGAVAPGPPLYSTDFTAIDGNPDFAIHGLQPTPGCPFTCCLHVIPLALQEPEPHRSLSLLAMVESGPEWYEIARVTAAAPVATASVRAGTTHLALRRRRGDPNGQPQPGTGLRSGTVAHSLETLTLTQLVMESMTLGPKGIPTDPADRLSLAGQRLGQLKEHVLRAVAQLMQWGQDSGPLAVLQEWDERVNEVAAWIQTKLIDGAPPDLAEERRRLNRIPDEILGIIRQACQQLQR